MPYTHFTPTERGQLQALLGQHLSPNAIARKLGRAPSSISRELRRNNASTTTYNAAHAQQRYVCVRKDCLRTKSLDHLPLRRYVIDAIADGWSPEEVSGRLWLDFPGQPRMRVSHETLYRTIYSDNRLGRVLIPYLRRRQPRRRKRGERKPSRPRIPNRVSIDARPPEVDALQRYGDWEGDTVIGARQEGALVTLVERKSMLLHAVSVPSKHAEPVAQAVIDALNAMPPSWRKTVTFDNGSEFACHERIAQATGAAVYFAHPYASYQRARNENTNGLLRQYYPKKTSFANLNPDQLRRIVHELNTRPRKKLGYRKPLEVFLQDCGERDP